MRKIDYQILADIIRAGRVLCYQQATNPGGALRFARMYGHRVVYRATPVKGGVA